MLGRWSQNLAVTTLELFTLGSVFCALIMYITLWRKPFGVCRPIVTHAKGSLPPITPSSALLSSGSCIITFRKGNPLYNILVFFISFCFGAIHLVAWNFYFPTKIEELLWRISCIGCTVTPALLFVWDALTYYVKVRAMPIAEVGVPSAIIAIYVLCRSYMLVEMFASLRSVPASVYSTPK